MCMGQVGEGGEVIRQDEVIMRMGQVMDYVAKGLRGRASYLILLHP